MQAILNEQQFPRAAIFVPMSLLIGVEDFRDGMKTELFPAASGKPMINSVKILLEREFMLEAWMMWHL